MRVPERIRQEETQDDTAEQGERSHEGEQPEPTSLAANTTHMQDTVCDQLRRGLAELVTEVEEHDTLGSLLPCVPCRQRPQATGDKTGLGHAEQETRSDERAVVVLECLEGTDGTEEEKLKSEPLAGTDAVQDHVGGDLEEDNAERQHLLSDVKLILSDVHICHHVVGDSVGDIAAVKLCKGLC